MTVRGRPATGIVGPVWIQGCQPVGVAGQPVSTLITPAMGPQGQFSVKPAKNNWHVLQ